MKTLTPQTFKGPADWFSGDVYPTIILTGEEPSRVHMGSVHFSPGARTAWHSHAVGQYLHIVGGTALVQERGKEIVTLTPRETIYTAPGIESTGTELRPIVSWFISLFGRRQRQTAMSQKQAGENKSLMMSILHSSGGDQSHRHIHSRQSH